MDQFSALEKISHSRFYPTQSLVIDKIAEIAGLVTATTFHDRYLPLWKDVSDRLTNHWLKGNIACTNAKMMCHLATFPPRTDTDVVTSTVAAATATATDELFLSTLFVHSLTFLRSMSSEHLILLTRNLDGALPCFSGSWSDLELSISSMFGMLDVCTACGWWSTIRLTLELGEFAYSDRGRLAFAHPAVPTIVQ